jgi:TRAP-type transport system small permease protein
MARFLFVWMIMIGAMVGVRESTHFVVDVWPRLAPRRRGAAALCSRSACWIIALVFVWGHRVHPFAWNRISELAELPLWIIHIAWPLAGLHLDRVSRRAVLDDLARILGTGG